jgi:DNA-binding MarR family transcriptional regulator
MSTPTSTPAAKPDAGLEFGFEALVVVLFMQAKLVRPIDDALDRAHHTNLTGYELLARLARMHPDGASVRYLSDQVVVSPSRVSRVAEEFVNRGLLERAASPHDGRLSLVRLTRNGRKQLAGMETTLTNALNTHFHQQLTPKQVRALIDIGRTLGSPHCTER